MAKENKNELIFTIINSGYSDLVMDAARRGGATGGTIFHARGTSNPDISKFFGISISPEKEVVLIVVPAKIKDDVVAAIYKDAGLDTRGQGVVLTLPVDDFVGPKIDKE